MRALTVRQPWAWALIHGGKNVENRTWSTGYRGPLAIHAAAFPTRAGVYRELLANLCEPEVRDALHRRYAGQGVKLRDVLTFGAVIGVIDLTDAHPSRGCCRPWAHTAPGVIHLVTANPQPVQPIPCKGRLGLWTPTPDLAAAITAGLDQAKAGETQ
ncbi:ASCH domain-containing protein [Actinopolymorpha alba]|uniref:ASCH domain-containing protein n=1 Tax=Actinopolymorpha alba TaxID=533267 RepID=UPI00037DDE08|nr:ASCH domain-containing protein [Actinopolymorpha alba]